MVTWFVAIVSYIPLSCACLVPPTPSVTSFTAPAPAERFMVHTCTHPPCSRNVTRGPCCVQSHLPHLPHILPVAMQRQPPTPLHTMHPAPAAVQLGAIHGRAEVRRHIPGELQHPKARQRLQGGQAEREAAEAANHQPCKAR